MSPGPDEQQAGRERRSRLEPDGGHFRRSSCTFPYSKPFDRLPKADQESATKSLPVIEFSKESLDGEVILSSRVLILYYLYYFIRRWVVEGEIQQFEVIGLYVIYVSPSGFALKSKESPKAASRSPWDRQRESRFFVALSL